MGTYILEVSAYSKTYTPEHLHNRNICISGHLAHPNIYTTEISAYPDTYTPEQLHNRNIYISGYLHTRTFTQPKYLHIRIPVHPNIYTIKISAYPNTCTSEHLHNRNICIAGHLHAQTSTQPKYLHIRIPAHLNIYTTEISTYPNTCTPLPIQIPPPKQSIPPNTSGLRIESLKKYARLFSLHKKIIIYISDEPTFQKEFLLLRLTQMSNIIVKPNYYA